MVVSRFLYIVSSTHGHEHPFRTQTRRLISHSSSNRHLVSFLKGTYTHSFPSSRLDTQTRLATRSRTVPVSAPTNPGLEPPNHHLTWANERAPGERDTGVSTPAQTSPSRTDERLPASAVSFPTTTAHSRYHLSCRFDPNHPIEPSRSRPKYTNVVNPPYRFPPPRHLESPNHTIEPSRSRTQNPRTYDRRT